MNKPLILVTNDDGISAPGIRTLIAIMSEIGDVVGFRDFKVIFGIAVNPERH